jgi:hypothetical protein
MIALAGLAMDLSIVVFGKQQLQHAADAAALAGAALVKTDPDASRLKAQEISLANAVYRASVALDLNTGNSEVGEIVLGYYDRKASVFTPDEVAPNAMKVSTRRTSSAHEPIPLVFGPMAGVFGVDVTAEAIAMVDGDSGAGAIVLNPSGECAADFGGNVLFNVTDMTLTPPDFGAIQVNSTSENAICADGNVDLETGEINVTGGADLGSNVSYPPDCEINEDAPPIPDPLAGLPDINPAGMPIVPIPDQGNFTAAPGYHLGQVKRTGDELVLESGIHVFDSGVDDDKSVALEVNGGSVVSEEGGGVLLYILRGAIKLEGNGIVELNPLDAPVGSPDADYNRITIFQARGNTSESFIAGGNAMKLTGTLYFPTNRVRIRGGGGGYGNQLIAYEVSTFGDGEIKIMYDGSNSAPGYDVFLVR